MGQFNELALLIEQYLPKLLASLAILVFGWIAALLVAAMIRGALRRTGLGAWLNRTVVGEDKKSKLFDVEHLLTRSVFYLIMIFVLVGFFQVLGLTLATEPLNRLLSEVFTFAPRLLVAGVLLLVAWIVASALKLVVVRLLGVANLDEKIGNQAGRSVSLTRTLGDTVYWVVFLLFLPAILNALALEGLLAPVQGMLDKILVVLPNIVSAGIILGVGWLLARIVQRIVSNLLVAVGVDRLSERVGLDRIVGSQGVSSVLGLVVYILILIPVLIASLNALALEAVTQPASNMLNTLLAALPAIFAAVLVLILAYVVGRVIAGLITNLLTGIGFNTVLSQIGLGRASTSQTGGRSPSEIVGFLVLVAVMLFATIEAARQLGFELLATLVADFTVFAGHIVLGLVIFGIGLYLADLASRTLRNSGAVQAGLMATSARLAIIVLSGAMALRQMGLASDIINLAFGLLLGAIVVAVALALGLGGREIAARELNNWIESLKTRRSRGSSGTN
ncbi:MAG: mechanosensitive ion channel [Deltaproteobacteria bacterium]|nr:mechanosensitive ion channel [Deltaproteobacteria bacterium]